MNSPVVRYLMATLFTVVAITATFLLAAFTVGPWIGQLGMVITVLLAGVVWWVVAARLFRITDGRR